MRLIGFCVVTIETHGVESAMEGVVSIRIVVLRTLMLEKAIVVGVTVKLDVFCIAEILY